MEFLSGIVERITYSNEENGFSVIKLKSKGFNDLVTVVGSMATVNIGSAVRVKGVWKNNGQYGRQFCAQEYEETVPATVKGIEKYLGSGLIKGIGPVNAKRIVDMFGTETIEVIESKTERLMEIEGIGEKRVQMIKKAWEEQKDIKNIMLFLQGNGVSASYAVKIYKAYGNESIELVKENPYRLAQDIWGIGFKTADGIARNMGYDENSIERCCAGAVYVLGELSNEGHCFSLREELVKSACDMLGVEAELVERAIDKMSAEQLLIEEESAVYIPGLYYSEIGAASRIVKIAAQKSSYAGFDTGLMLEAMQSESGMRYDKVQLEAIRTAVNSKFMVLTGGPGTGKTTTTNAIIKLFERLGAKVSLAAPTGRAAKRLSETTGKKALTIHRLLEFKPPAGYQKNQDNPLPCDVLVIDEASMVDIVMMNTLLKAVRDEAVVILVGDVDQLPSVGPGKVLQDIIASGAVPVVKLERIFRQAMGSRIITNAHKINKGQFPDLSNSKKSDFFFMEEEDPEKVALMIRELCSSRLPKYYGVDAVDDIQVICPMQRGSTGTVSFNQTLQEVLNPSGVSVRYAGVEYRVGDKVMQIKNNYDKNVFNGDIGRIRHIDKEAGSLAICFDDRLVEYDTSDMNEVVLAYATTVHKSQGSEYRVVVAPITMQHFVMLQRNLIYTCITRAKQVLVLVGSKKAIAMAVKNNKIVDRNTRLSERIIKQA